MSEIMIILPNHPVEISIQAHVGDIPVLNIPAGFTTTADANAFDESVFRQDPKLHFFVRQSVLEEQRQSLEQYGPKSGQLYFILFCPEGGSHIKWGFVRECGGPLPNQEDKEMIGEAKRFLQETWDETRRELGGESL